MWKICSFCLFFVSVCHASFSQLRTPKSELRLNAFNEQRTQGSEEVNFGKLHFEAFQKQQRSFAKAGEDSWFPIGPMDTKGLSGSGRINSMTFHPTDSNTFYICVAQGGLWKTTDHGEHWENISAELPILRTSHLAIHPQHFDTMYLATGDFAYLGHNLAANGNKRHTHYGMGIYKTVDGGKSWSATGLSFEQESFEGSLISRILIHPDNPDHLIAGTQTGVYKSIDAGNNWTQTQTDIIWDMEANPSNPNFLVASTGFVASYEIGRAGILHSTDFGSTWQKSITPIDSVDAVQRIEMDISLSNPHIMKAITCDVLGGFEGIYESKDSGKSWSQLLDTSFQYNLLGWNFDQSPGGQGRYDLTICIDSKNPDLVHIGGVNGYTSNDGGKTFEPFTYWALNYQGLSLHADIHQFVQHPFTSDLFACHDGGISRTQKVVANTPEELNDGITGTQWRHFTKNLNITSFYRVGLHPTQDTLMAGAQDNSTIEGQGTNWSVISGGDGMESSYDMVGLAKYSSSQNGRINQFFAIDADQNLYYYNQTIRPPRDEIAEWTTPFNAESNGIIIGYANVYWMGTFEDDLNRLSDFPAISGTSIKAPITALSKTINDETIYIAHRGYASRNTNSQIRMTKDNGDQWIDISNGLPIEQYPTYITVDNQNKNHALITFSGFIKNKKVYETFDAGETWTNISYNLPNIPVNCVDINENNEEIFIATDLGIYKLKDEVWQVFNDNLPNVIVSEIEVDESRNRLVAATFGSGVWATPLGNSVSATNKIWTINNIDLYPNPAFETINIQTDLTNLNYKVINASGVMMSDGNTITNKTIEITHYYPGVYFISFYQGEKLIGVKKWIKE
jgi:photosystem II stability/assembly factor-like uncharacterized protein